MRWPGTPGALLGVLEGQEHPHQIGAGQHSGAGGRVQEHELLLYPCCSGSGGAVTGRRWTGSRSMRGGGVRPGGWTSAIRGSCIRCWWIDMRARLARSARPDRIFEVTLVAARQAGVVGRRRVLVCHVHVGVPSPEAGVQVLARPRPWLAPLLTLVPVSTWNRISSCAIPTSPPKAGPGAGAGRELLATVTGQDLDRDAAGVFKIARQVAPHRVISTVDPQARHGHKTSHRSFDGYKGHIAGDPDSEIITATDVTAGNSGDAEAAEGLIADLLPGDPDNAGAEAGGRETGVTPAGPGTAGGGSGQAAVFGDAAYGSGELVERVEDAGIYSGIKVQPPPAVKGHFPKDRFAIDPDGQAVTCPAGITAPIRASGRDRHAGEARFCAACRTCPLAAQCTTAKGGRTITIGPHEARLAAARQAQASPAWKADYKATRPKVERKIGHLMRRRRAPRPGPRAAQGRRRLRSARRRSQPGPPRRARHCLPQRRLGGRRRLITGNGRPRASPARSQATSG